MGETFSACAMHPRRISKLHSILFCVGITGVISLKSSSAISYRSSWSKSCLNALPSSMSALEQSSGPKLTHRISQSIISGTISRRSWVSSAITLVSLSVQSPSEVSAIITDETDTFADNWWDSSTSSQPSAQLSSPSQTLSPPSPPQSQAAASDEISITISKRALTENAQADGGSGTQFTLGLELAEIEFRTMLRVFVKSVTPHSLASDLGIQKDWIAVSINDVSVERTNAKGVAQILAQAMNDPQVDTIVLTFRDPSIFRDKLQQMSTATSSSSSSKSSSMTVTTQVAPAGETTQRNADGSVRPGRKIAFQDDQKVTVTQLIPPKMCTRGASLDDLLEISYVGRLYDNPSTIFDGSAVMINDSGIPGRGNDVSVYFVLGKQPFGQFPPGWDVGLVGICVGERRRLVIPPALAYGKEGLPRRGIPGDATLQYDITLVSLNGLSTPQ